MEIYCNGFIGDLPIKLKILSTDKERSLGYQHQKSSPEYGEGLLFLFDESEERDFHMRNVNFDLDLLGFDFSGKMRCKIPMKNNSQIVYKTPPVKFIVEVPRGWSNGLRPEKTFLRITEIK